MHADVAAIAERELGDVPTRIRAVEEGLLHETYEFECGGEAYVLQFASDEDDGRSDDLRRGLHCYRLLRDADVPVPRVVTEEIREVDDREYAIVERLPGESGERAVSPARTRNAGRYLARIHDAREFDAAGWLRFEDGEPVVREFGEGSHERWRRRRVEDSARVLREGGMERAGGAVRRLFDQASPGPPGDFRPVLCHDDYSPDNLLFRDGEVTGILDFDRARAGHDLRDLAKAANCFWMHDPGADWRVRERFYEGYRAERAVGEAFETVEPRYRATTLAGVVAGMQQLGELSEYERAFYDERISEAVERIEEA